MIGSYFPPTLFSTQIYAILKIDNLVIIVISKLVMDLTEGIQEYYGFLFMSADATQDIDSWSWEQQLPSKDENRKMHQSLLSKYV